MTQISSSNRLMPVFVDCIAGSSSQVRKTQNSPLSTSGNGLRVAREFAFVEDQLVQVHR
jgi:hypothetical protein